MCEWTSGEEAGEVDCEGGEAVVGRGSRGNEEEDVVGDGYRVAHYKR